MVARTEARAGLACALITMAALATDAMGGNEPLMQQARQKAFLLNEHVVRQLGLVEQTSNISLTGRVKRLPDGRWQVVIDNLDVQGPIQSGSFPFNEASGKDPIEYVIFEEMSGPSAPGETP